MIGEKLSALLECKKMRAGTLATLTGIPKSTIYSILKRNNKSVDFSVIEKIAEVLDVPVEYFYDRSASRNALTETEKPVNLEVDGLEKDFDEINKIFSELSPENRSKLLELSRLYLGAQHNSEDSK